jgi:transposase-like protein
VEVQRCQIHKRRNVKEYLPENCQKDYDQGMRNAYAMNNYAEAKEAFTENLPATGEDQSQRYPEPVSSWKHRGHPELMNYLG